MLETPGRDKHYSLLYTFINFGCKEFYIIGARVTKLGDLSFDVDILAFLRNRTTKVVNLVTLKAPA